MSTPMTKIEEIDPKGDILLHFPGVSVPHQLNGLAETSRGKQPDIPTLVEPWQSPGTASLCSHVETQSLGASPGPSNHGYGSGVVIAGPSLGAGGVLEHQPGIPEQRTPCITLRVSSSVLCLVSPVFAVMLNGPMAEGQAFRAPNSPRPFPITLHEDDGQIFSILANVVHHRADEIPFLPTTSTLVALAAIVDKYACGPAIMPYGVLWVQRAADRRDDPEYAGLLGRCNLLLFSYVIDLPEQFAGLSWDVLLMHRQTLKDETEFGLELPISPDHELLRHDLHGEIARRKARLRREVHASLMEPVQRVTSQLNFHSSSSHHSSDHQPPETRPTCPNAALAIGNYMALLDFYNLSPWRPQYETDSFSAIINRALEVAKQGRDNPMLLFEMCTRHRCACDIMVYGDGVHMADRLAFQLEPAWKWKLWVCLDCLKSGGEDKERGRCRVKHW